MTISSATNKAIFPGNGAQTSFSFTFVGVTAADLSLTLTDSAGNQTALVRGIDYSLTLNAAVAGAIWGLGGVVTYPLVGPPLATLSSLTLLRTVPLLQPVSLNNQGAEFPASVEQGLDLLAMIAQQISELNARSIVVPASDPSAPSPVPTVAQRANLAFIWDSNGQPAAGAIPASGVISAAMVPVVGAATLATGRTAFGLGAMATEGIGGGLQDDGAGKARVIFTPTAVAVAQAPVATDHLKRFIATGPITFTLARANTYFAGYGFWVDVFTGTVTFAIDSHDQINGTTASGVSLSVPPGYKVLIYTDAAASGAWYVAAYAMGISGNALPALSAQSLPGGRLTLTTAVPVLSADTTGIATIIYTPYLHGRLPLYDGVSWVTRDSVEMSQVLSDNTKSPAAAAANSVYDLFGWDDAGTLRMTRGPLWTSATARGAGAGTTELVYQNGILVNANAITNGPAAKRGTYLGTIATDGSIQLNMMFAPAAAAGGNSCRLDVWNMYNRLPATTLSRDSTDTWAYVTATMRSANNSTSNRITAVYGLNEVPVRAQYHGVLINNNGGVGIIGVGLDSTSAMSGVPATGARTSTADPVAWDAIYAGLPGLGRHFFQALEQGAASIGSWCGDNGTPLIIQMGLFLQDLR